MNVYSVRKIDNSAIDLPQIDWKKINPLNDFQYPWIKGKTPEMSFRGCWNNAYFFFQFDVVDENVLVYHDTDKKDEVELSDRVEIFFKTNDDLSPYYCLEMDPDGRVFDYEGRYYRDFNKLWSWPEGQLKIEAEITRDGYKLQGRISINSLKELNLWNNGIVQAGLFRGDCVSLKDRKAELTWISWVNPEIDEPDFHIAKTFGELHFE